MKIHRYALSIVLPLFILALASAGPANAATAASLKILVPANDAQLDAGEPYPLQYEIALGPGDDHFHVWVDGDRSPGIHDLKGTYTLPKLSPGDHVITLKLVDKGHVPTGPETSIKVHVK